AQPLARGGRCIALERHGYQRAGRGRRTPRRGRRNRTMKYPAEICAEIENSLPLYVGGDLESEAIAATEAHLGGCSSCAARARQAREAHGLLVSALKLTSTRGPDLWAGVRAVLVDEGLVQGARAEQAAASAPIKAPVARVARHEQGSKARRWFGW